MGDGDYDVTGIARLTAAAVAVAALIFVVAILGSAEGDNVNERAILLLVAFVPFSLCGLAGLRLIERRPQLAIAGVITIGLAAIAFAMVVDRIWSFEVYRRPESPEVVALFALAAGQAAMLLSFERDDDTLLVRGVRYGAVAALAVAAVVAAIEISNPGRDVGIRPIAAAAVLYLLGVVLPPLLRRADLTDV